MYKEYADLKLQLRILEAKEAQLKLAILSDLHKQKVDKIEGDYGKFTICQKKRWTYSRKLQKFEEDIKIQKIEEQESGKAKSEDSEYVMYKPLT